MDVAKVAHSVARADSPIVPTVVSGGIPMVSQTTTRRMNFTRHGKQGGNSFLHIFKTPKTGEHGVC